MSWARQGSSWSNCSDGRKSNANQIGVGWALGRDSLVGEEEAKMKGKNVEIGKHKKDGQSQAQGANGEVVVNKEWVTKKSCIGNEQVLWP